MALVVNTNVPSIASQRYLMESRKEMETAMERLSSGKRINSAADDAAGLAISTRMDSQIKGLNMAIRNANDGISLAQTAEGAISEVTDMLQRMRELALQSVHGVNNDEDRAALDAEVQQLKAEIDRIAESTTFNNQALLDGTFDRLLQIGKDASDVMGISIQDMSTSALGMNLGGSSDSAPDLISARLTTSTFYDTDGATGGGSWQAGDIVINGQELGAFDGTSAVTSGGHDFYDLVTNINDNVDNVVATAKNIVVAKSVGDGVLADSKFAIKVHQIGTTSDAHYVPSVTRVLGASNSMDELVQNINDAFDDSVLEAYVNSEGRLVLQNDTGARIQVADISGTNGAYDGGSGFKVDTTSITTYGTDVFGFLQLSSTDGTAIEITAGNDGLASPGADSDLALIGFNSVDEDPTGNFYTLTGTQLTSSLVSDKFQKDDQTGQADLTINGVEIYDDTLSATSDTFQGKLDLINSFTDETGVVASAYFKKVVDMSQTTFVTDNKVKINGVDINYGSDLAGTVTNINAQKSLTGITAEASGNNLILKGDGVQTANIENVEFELSSSTKQASARRSTDTAGQTQSVTFSTADLTAGRVVTLTIKGDTAGAGLSSTSVTFSHTVRSTDSAADVAKAFRDLLLVSIQNNDQMSAGSAGTYLSADASGALLFKTAMSIGSATITIGVTQTTAANLMTSVAAGTTATYYAALRLQSTANSPISIEMGESATASEGGFLETNVGDSTWDVNTATANLEAYGASAPVSGMSVATSSAAQTAIEIVDGALSTVSDVRADLGAIQNRLDHTVSNLANVVENTSAAQSRIQDADFALEAAALARAQILQQAGTAMLAQANAAPQNVLSLLS